MVDIETKHKDFQTAQNTILGLLSEKEDFGNHEAVRTAGTAYYTAKSVFNNLTKYNSNNNTVY